ncbi:phosphate signaling complex protein PhoU [Desulfatibacillum aliphaticivorans]|nr:phosphate signaling complex protein PhoU [Desulfatibacillum aliphaticivorans]
MGRPIHTELDNIKKLILSLGAMVEERVRQATKALTSRDLDLAKKVIKSDYEIDEAEVEVEEECLKIIALHQPVAVDLRFLACVLKINNDLERIGDQAVNIAQRVITIMKAPPMDLGFEFGPMSQKTQAMLKNSLDALVAFDVDLAYQVCLDDDEVDDAKRQIYDIIKKALQEHPENAGVLINILLASRHLERIADHSTNIAEEVIYLIEGEIHRHKIYERRQEKVAEEQVD